MNERRAAAYGRLTRTLERAYPDALTFAERELLRESADTLLFISDLGSEAAKDAIDGALIVFLRLRATDPDDRWVDYVADELEAVGPAGP